MRLATLIGFLALIVSWPASAQTCAPRRDLVKNLEENYGESLVFGGLQEAREKAVVLEVWVSRDTGTYTILLTQANGISCVVAVGTEFFELGPPEELVGDPL